MRKLAVGAILAAFAAVSPARAQRVSGTLRDSASREPIAGAVVTLTDSAGALLGRSLADASGHFSVMRFPDVRRMRVVRIGYRPVERTIAPADSIVDLSMQAVPAMLGAVAASDTRICPGSPALGSAALELWEQARAGLLASAVAREVVPAKVRLRSYRRTLEPNGRAAIADTIEYRDLVVDRSFVAARPAWYFADRGYMRELFDGSREYLAPDEMVLLDATFAATHCLHVVDGTGARIAQVGIAFEPVRGAVRDTMVDVEGVLWLSRTNLELRRLEFHYANIERDAREAGGEVDFTLTPAGAPMIERWSIHSPMLAYDGEGPQPPVRRIVPRPDRRNVRILAFRETGGQVAHAAWPDGSEWRSNLPHLTGTVADTSGAPVANAIVWLKNTPDTTRTRADGTFELPPVPPGQYVVMASDSALAREGVSRAPPRMMLMFADGMSVADERTMSRRADIRLVLHPRAEVLPTLCPARSYKPGTGILLARVVDAEGRPVPRAEVEVELVVPRPGADSAAGGPTRWGVAGDDGKFVVCGISHAYPLVVRAFSKRMGGGVLVERWGDEVVSVTIPLRAAPPP